MSNLPITRQELSPALPKAAVRLVDIQRGRAAIAGAKIDAVAFAGTVAMLRAAELSDLEVRLIQMAPLGEARFQAIADTTCMAMLSVMQRIATEVGH